MSWKKYVLGDILKRKRTPEKIDPEKEYKLVTIKLYHKGVIPRSIVKGATIKSPMSSIRSGDFVLSGIDARNGAFGIVPAELEGAVITNDFWCIEPDETKISKDFFLYITTTPFFDYICKQSSDGTTQRIRLQKDRFFNYEIELPNIEAQKEILQQLNFISYKKGEITSELTHQLDLVKQLRQSFLREAMQGKLVKSSNTKETGQQLLEKIKSEKAQLIAEKKLKKEKPLAAITDDDIPFEIPEHWVWCRGNDVATYIDPQPSHRTPPESKDGIPYVAMSDIKKDGTIDFSSTRKVSFSVLKEHKNRYHLEDGDFIFGKIGTLGKPVLLPKPFEYTLSANVILIQSNRKIIRDDYLFYFLGSPIAEKELLDKKSTTSYPVFGMAKARNMIIPLPPLHEQQQIVSKLNELMSFCDGLEQSIKKSQGYNEKLLQQVLREALQA